MDKMIQSEVSRDRTQVSQLREIPLMSTPLCSPVNHLPKTQLLFPTSLTEAPAMTQSKCHNLCALGPHKTGTVISSLQVLGGITPGALEGPAAADT